VTWLGVLVTIGRALLVPLGGFFIFEALGSAVNGWTRIKDGHDELDWKAKIEFPLRGLRAIAGIMLASLVPSSLLFIGAGLLFVLEAPVAVGLRMDEVDTNIERNEGGKLPDITGSYGGSLRMKFRFLRALLGIALLEVGHFI